MRFLLRLFGLILIASLAILFSSITLSFIQKEWFGVGRSGSKNHVAVLEVSGVLYSSTRFLKDLKEVLDQSHVKALVVRINSPGGLVAPSQEMYEALKAADQKIPVIVSMSALAASGGYYMALGAREIFASPGTLTASIGVIMEYVNMEKLYQWAKIERQTIKAGKLKDVGSPFRPMKPEERLFLEALLKDTHDQFRAAVKERRKLSPEEVEQWCDGRVMTGRQAKEAKLVDTLGGFDDAVKQAKKLAKLPDNAPVDMPEKRKGVLREMLFGEEESSMEKLFLSIFEKAQESALSPGWNVLYLSSFR